MTAWQRAVHEAITNWRYVSRNAVADFKWDCRLQTLDSGHDDIPF
jgi:hypothetical protein